jgi:predicted metal-dependent phosphotriesterase family hydrolase
MRRDHVGTNGIPAFVRSQGMLNINRRTGMVRTALTLAIGLVALHIAVAAPAAERSAARGAARAVVHEIMTVSGSIPAEDLGVTLPHEHVLVDFIGAESASSDRYDADEVFEVMLPYLQEAARIGISSFFDCTPAYLGRDPALLSRLATAADISIVTNTGYYGAANDKFVPAHAYAVTADELAAGWIAEWEFGIDGTEIRPGFIKVGVDPGRLSDIDRKIVEAAATTHLATGLTIACHTGEAQAARDVIDTVRAGGVDPSALIIVHAEGIGGPAAQLELAESGVWIEYDGVRPGSSSRHVRLIETLLQAGFGDRILLSHDAGWYQVGDPQGGSTRPYTAISHELIPALERAGISCDVVEAILIDNPARAFAVRVRRTTRRK